jgi:hypothetical protein
MKVENQKIGCAETISFGLNRAAGWRYKKAKQYSNDPRNHRVAELLLKLAGDSSNLTEDIESVQVFFQFLNLLNRKTSTGILINGLSFLCALCWQITVQGSLLQCGHGPSESRTRGYATLSRLDL